MADRFVASSWTGSCWCGSRCRPRLIILVFSYPKYVESLQDLPLIGDFVPSVDSMVIMIVFTMMAVGLNIVVGYAGLLDLGYVAFYAAGAYIAGLVRVAAVRPVDVPLRRGRDQQRRCPGSISRSGSCC